MYRGQRREPFTVQAGSSEFAVCLAQRGVKLEFQLSYLPDGALWKTEVCSTIPPAEYHCSELSVVNSATNRLVRMFWVENLMFADDK